MPDAAKLSRRERERAAHRRAMLDAAERVFVQKGYHEATVEQIAQEAEFSVGTLYNFFGSKDDLYAHVVEKLAREFFEAVEGHVLSRTDPEEAIGALIELRLRYLEDHKGFFRVFLETSPGGSVYPTAAMPESCQALCDQYFDAVVGVFRRGVEQGVFDKADPLYLALCLEGIINVFEVYWSRKEPAESLDVRIAKMKWNFLGRIKVRLPDPDGLIDRWRCPHRE